MKNRSKQITFALSTLMMGALFADSDESFNSDEMDNMIVENMLVENVSIENLIADSGSKSKSSKAKKKGTIEDYSQFILWGDFLYWKTDVEGSEFAERGPVTIPAAAGDVGSVSLKTGKVEGKWEPGVRIGAGYKFANYDDWTLGLVWTHMNARSKHVSLTSNGTDNLMFPTGVNALGPQALTATAHWKLNTNMLDLCMGRAYAPTKKISLMPHAGIRAAWFDYSFKESFLSRWEYFASPTPTLASRAFFDGNTSGKSSFEYKAIGLNGGMAACWALSNQWSIDAKFSTSLLYGKYDVKQSYTGFEAGGIDNDFPLFNPVAQNMSKEFWRVRANVDAFLGIMWKMRFDDDKCSFSLAAGYELSQWFQLNEISTVSDNRDVHTDYDEAGTPFTVSNYSISEFSTHGDVSFQGLTARVGFEF